MTGILPVSGAFRLRTQAVSFGNFDEYVGNWQRINEQTYDPKLTDLQNYNRAFEAGRNDKAVNAATIKLGTILATEGYVVGVAPQIVAHA